MEDQSQNNINQYPPTNTQPNYQTTPIEIVEDKETEEVKVIEQEIEKRFYDTPKFRLWISYMTDRSNKETFGNQTQSAIYAYNLDPKRQYQVAAVIGNKNIKKVKALGSMVLSKMGINYGTILAGAWRKALTQKDNSLLNWVVQVSGIEFPVDIPVNANGEGGTINNTQINLGVNLEQLNDGQLKQLIETKRANLARTGVLLAVGGGEESETKPAEVHTPTPEAVPSDDERQSY